MIQLTFVEIRVTGVADEPLVLMAEEGGVRELPIWTTAAGANAILTALEADEGLTPGIHDLMLDALALLDTVIDEARIVACVDGVFAAEIVVAGSSVTARVTDAIALALRSGARILAAEELMDAVAVGGHAAAEPNDLHFGADAQMERFRAFLDTISPDDFEARGEQP